jgi:hypothetical protein
MSINESNAEPRIAREPEKKPIIALSIARRRDITSANLIPKDGVEGSFIMRGIDYEWNYLWAYIFLTRLQSIWKI